MTKQRNKSRPTEKTKSRVEAKWKNKATSPSLMTKQSHKSKPTEKTKSQVQIKWQKQATIFSKLTKHGHKSKQTDIIRTKVQVKWRNKATSLCQLTKQSQKLKPNDKTRPLFQSKSSPLRKKRPKGTSAQAPPPFSVFFVCFCFVLFFLWLPLFLLFLHSRLYVLPYILSWRKTKVQDVLLHFSFEIHDLI